MAVSESEWALLARYVYTYEEFVFVTEATAVQQNYRTEQKHLIKRSKAVQLIELD